MNDKRCVIGACHRVKVFHKRYQGFIQTACGFIGFFGSAIKVCQFLGSERRKSQSHTVMHVNITGFHDNKENKTIVFTFALGLPELHITQKVHGAIHPDANFILRQDEDHGLGDIVSIKLVQVRVNFGHGLFGSIPFPSNRPMRLHQVIVETVIRGGAITAKLRSREGIRMDRGKMWDQSECKD